MNGKKYQRNILIDINIIGEYPVFPQRRFAFQHDFTPPHRAKGTHELLQMKNVDVLPLVANSPDLNPIEKLWSIIKKENKRNELQLI